MFEKGFVKLSLLFAGVLALVGVAGYLVSARNVNAIQQDSITINHQEFSCGEQNTIFTGSATYDISSEYYRYIAVFLNGNPNPIYTNYGDSNYEPSVWSSDSVHLIPGSYEVLAGTVDYGSNQAVAVDGWDFDIEDCLGNQPLCHVPPGNPENAHTVYINEHGYNGHFDNEGELHGEDYFGECTIPTDTSKEHVCLDEEALNFDEDFDEKTEVGDVEVCKYEQVTPTPTPEEPKHDNPITEASAPVCTNGEVLALPANVHGYRGDDPNTLQVEGLDVFTIHWVPTGGDQINVYVYDGQNVLVGAKADQPNSGMVVIDHLNSDEAYTFDLEQKNGCGGGNLARVRIIDGAFSKLFISSSWLWSN